MTIGSGTSEIRQRIKRRKKERKKHPHQNISPPGSLPGGLINQIKSTFWLSVCTVCEIVVFFCHLMS